MWNNTSSFEYTADTRTIEGACAPTRPRRVRKQVQNQSRRPESKIPSRRQFHTIHEERPISSPRTKAPVVKDDPSRETSVSTNATAENVCEDDWAEQGSPAKPGAQKHLPTRAGRGWGQTKQQKAHCHRQKTSSPCNGRKDLAAPESMVTPRQVADFKGTRTDYSCLYHDPEGVTKREQILNALYGHGLRGGEDQLAVRYPRSGISWDGAHSEAPATPVTT